MFDLSKEKVTVRCKCGRSHSVSLKDTIDQKSFQCSCGTQISLTDKNGSVRKSVADVDRAMSDLEKAFRRLGS